MAIFGDRVAGLPRLLDVLYYHPQGMRFADLAAEVGRSERDVRETLRAYHLTDLAHYLPHMVARPEVLEFFGDHPDDDGDPLRAPSVRLVAAHPGQELGIDYIAVTDLARLFRIATDALTLRPEDAVLASAVRKLHEGLLPGLRIIADDPWERLAEIRTAITEHRRLAITYARAWSPEIEELVVEPYWLSRTHRGWELDAGPGDELSGLRTYLLANVRALQPLIETFEPLADVAAAINLHRREHAVIIETPHEARWAVDKYAERVELIRDGIEAATLRVFLLQPVRLRVGLMLVVGGPTARVVAPAELRPAGPEVARRILRSYD